VEVDGVLSESTGGIALPKFSGQYQCQLFYVCHLGGCTYKCLADLATVDILEEARSNGSGHLLLWFVTSQLAGGGGEDMCGLFILPVSLFSLLSSFMQQQVLAIPLI
jgi:hypothetical protein